MLPSDTSASGHVTDVKENTPDGFPTGHALRHTWIAHAQSAGVPKFLPKIITNHGSKGDDVHDGYISVPALRAELMKHGEPLALLKVRSAEARRARSELLAQLSRRDRSRHLERSQRTIC